MEKNDEEDNTNDEDGANNLNLRACRLEEEHGGTTPAPFKITSRREAPDILDNDWEGPYNEQVESVRTTGEQRHRDERDDLSVSPFSFMDTCNSFISSLSSTNTSTHHHSGVSSSSSSSVLCLTPPLPPTVELSAVLTHTRLTLDVYRSGASVLPRLWGSIPEHLRGIQYLKLGSEDKTALDGALDVLPHLKALRSLAIRGHRFYDSQGTPLLGLLTTLPTSLSSLSLLVHVDLSFNQLSILPSCLLSLPVLSALLLCYNRLLVLPPDIGHLSTLTYLSLSGNKLVSLPASLGDLKKLQSLDVSDNLLEELPNEIGSLGGLVTLELPHNKLKWLPETLGCLHSLRALIIFSNDLRLIPPCLSKLPLLKMDVRDNPLGRLPTPPPLLPTPNATANIPESHLLFNQHSFSVTSAGCHVFLPGGAELLFPPGCLHKPTTLEWVERRPQRKWVLLEEHDILLSHPLELRPHGVTFLKPVEVCLPHHRKKGREVVVRKYDGKFWSTLPTVLKKGIERQCIQPYGRPARLACCSVNQFSWFIVVARPATDSCSVTPAGALLVSSTDPGVKLHFPPDSTSQTRAITLQVVQVSVAEVQVLCGDPQVSVSPLLCLSQTPSMHFLQPIKVQVPLPPGVTGHTVDMSCLYLLHGDPTAQTWTDITSQVSLSVTHLYAIFYIKHFSWYWLWYRTQSCVSGMVRKVYQKLKQFKVQFLVLQRKTDVSQVLLQCLPTNKVEDRVQSLSEQYNGPQPSDLCDLLEGEQFFAGFERGLDICTDRPDCVGGRLCFVFYSSLKNLKEVYISPAQGLQGPVRGQVSFYRGEIPSHLPEEVLRKRKGLDSQWLATLPLSLPALNSENKYIMEEFQHPPLNLGDPESGYVTEANLLSISLQIGQDWRIIGINLGLKYQELDRIQFKYRDNLGALVLDMLFLWARGQTNAGPGAVSRLTAAMIESGRRDIADEIEDIVCLGRQKYSESLRRVGLEAEGQPLCESQQERNPRCVQVADT
ncbi:p53-induced death domain-containing protein 1 isoform X2 [Dunckerocampus dactyliophorus]|uniref:p53-induced death domain-containing protein 1 isoform X2 n=1 Tax=Dunckerocampus dactyliophorus TaxID=161453 RepID=UPI002405C04D|nr:p53-induced death domain-containing protein 1 isoform X2 [Dunckerocampus dactyliophorus]